MAFFNEFPHTRTYDNDLGWLIKKVKELVEQANSEMEAIAELQQFMEELKSGDFPQGMIDALNEWILTHLDELIGDAIKMVFFGLTADGYFVAYIPDGWDEITFNTTEYDIDVTGFDTYGHLVLSY